MECPLCNGYKTIEQPCNKCGSIMEDTGKLTDYYGDYSPYMEADLMKLVDGYKNSLKDHECPHLFQCNGCGDHKVFLIQEEPKSPS